MNIGIVGCGSIAKIMANTINKLNNSEIVLYAVASRTYSKALDFKNQFSAKIAYGSYDELFKDENVDLVYIATPHSKHYENMLQALNNNKNILCEKPFAINYKQALDIITLAKNKNLFVCEAMWTRFMPSRQIIKDLIDSNIIGNITSLSANLGYAMQNIKRLCDPYLAGGALLDVGIYPLNFALMCFGNNYDKIVASCMKSELGVDLTDSITIYYKDKVCHLHSTMLSQTDRSGYLYADKGYIQIENINNPEAIRVYDLNHKLINSISIPSQITGYEYELISCLKALKLKQIETIEMPHKETLFVMKVIDEIKSLINLKYPIE